MIRLQQLVAKYLLGRDIAGYYEQEKAFYEEYILDEENLRSKKQDIDEEGRNMWIFCSLIPNLSYGFGIASLVFREPSLLALNIGGESMRWIGRYFFNMAKRSNGMFKNDQLVLEELREDLSKMGREGHDTRNIEGHLD